MLLVVGFVDLMVGDVVLEGCSNDGVFVDSNVGLSSKLSSAELVCDLELVEGFGLSGMMDDLERFFAEFQVLSNSS